MAYTTFVLFIKVSRPTFHQQSGIMERTLNPSFTAGDNKSIGYTSRSDSLGAADGLTGKVGTALYVSPEVMDVKTMAHYNQVCGASSVWVYLYVTTPIARAKWLMSTKVVVYIHLIGLAPSSKVT